MTEPSIVERGREWLLLEQLQSNVERVPDDVRERTSQLFSLSRERGAAAEALWLSGFSADALRLAEEAVELARDGASAGDVVVTNGSDSERYRQLRDTHVRILRGHEPLTLERRAVTRRRRARLGLVALSFLFVVAALIGVIRWKHRVRAVASAEFTDHYTALEAVDGDKRTEWLLPDKTPGFIDVQVAPRRSISRVKLMNARNIPFNDRSTREVIVEAFDGMKVVKTGTASFDGHSETPTWRTIELGATIDRVRVHIKSWDATGGGLAEVVVE